MNYCKDCKYRDDESYCTNTKLCSWADNTDYTLLTSDMLIIDEYPLDDDLGCPFFGVIVGDDFGCVHFKNKRRLQNEM